ncbi:hypothetical protein NDU88_006617 [Pleurodeles waltl]|uniref:Uncharacterized protein n=1 Tax=Pleurodeles waltl TaxID=8319 RepID=A0AAV7X228_PLEWA|nr:hypothetical protein NDU88_006617 [Pleurodeles waltl]
MDLHVPAEISPRKVRGCGAYRDPRESSEVASGGSAQHSTAQWQTRTQMQGGERSEWAGRASNRFTCLRAQGCIMCPTAARSLLPWLEASDRQTGRCR